MENPKIGRIDTGFVDGSYLATKWHQQKWEYRVEQYSFIIGDGDQQHMNDLGGKGWELFHQAVSGDPYKDVVCTFKRPKAVDES